MTNKTKTALTCVFLGVLVAAFVAGFTRTYNRSSEDVATDTVAVELVDTITSVAVDSALVDTIVD